MTGNMPFLIGLPPLKVMGAAHGLQGRQISFRFNNLSLAVNHTIYRVRLISHSSHLRLVLQETSSFSRTLPENESLSIITTQLPKKLYNEWDNPHLLPGPTLNTVDVNASSSCQTISEQKAIILTSWRIHVAWIPWSPRVPNVPQGSNWPNFISNSDIHHTDRCNPSLWMPPRGGMIALMT